MASSATQYPDGRMHDEKLSNTGQATHPLVHFACKTRKPSQAGHSINVISQSPVFRKGYLYPKGDGLPFLIRHSDCLFDRRRPRGRDRRT